MPGSGSFAQGSDQARTVRSTQASSTEVASAAAVRVCAPYWQAWRRRRPSYTSICQVCAVWVSGSFTVAPTVGRCPVSAGNDQYR